jgi:hypothetical protein
VKQILGHTTEKSFPKRRVTVRSSNDQVRFLHGSRSKQRLYRGEIPGVRPFVNLRPNPVCDEMIFHQGKIGIALVGGRIEREDRDLPSLPSEARIRGPRFRSSSKDRTSWSERRGAPFCQGRRLIWLGYYGSANLQRPLQPALMSATIR